MTDEHLPDSAVATGRGDDGTTGLLFGGDRVSKDDLRTEAYGAIDEAVAALGMARAELNMKREYGVLSPGLTRLPDLLLRFQRELFVVGAELATAPGMEERQVAGVSRVSAEMVAGLDEVLAEMERHIEIPREFIVPGETRLSAALEVARTILRRAERRAVAVRRAGLLPAEWLLPYLNRLADLVWILARAAELGEARDATPARPGRRRRRDDRTGGQPGGGDLA